MWSRPVLLALLRRFGIAFLILSVAAVGGVAAGDQFGRHEYAKRKTIHLNDGVLAPQVAARPANFLLIGHDEFGNSDTMMVVHVDPAVRTPLLVSFPRDLIVNIPGHGQGQLNAAFPLGGPGLLIQTLQADFQIPIQHYLQVDFASFPKIVDAIGHVNVWFPTAVHDPYIGLNINQPGCVSLDGPTALAYVRSRHYYVPDNLTNPTPWQWNYDPRIPENAYRGGTGWVAGGSDIDRIPRQQYFLRTLAQTAINKTDDDPLKIIGVVDAVVTHLTTDQTLTLTELKALVRTFRRVKPADVEMLTLPWEPDPANQNRVVVKYPDATPVIDQLANFTPPAPFIPVFVNPNLIRVRVVDGSGIAGLGTRVLNELAAAGFRAAGSVGVADRTYPRTQVRYAPGKNSQGLTVIYATGARDVGQSPVAADTLGADVLVIVGRDWSTLHAHLTNLANVIPSAHPNATTTTTQAPLPTTTTTVDRRYIPVNPKTGGVLVGCP
jgi:LCP family protein required for cell wall assembly